MLKLLLNCWIRTNWRCCYLREQSFSEAQMTNVSGTFSQKTISGKQQDQLLITLLNFAFGGGVGY
jgi:hypothetical protein